jgi:hypothetical protein
MEPVISEVIPVDEATADGGSELPQGRRGCLFSGGEAKVSTDRTLESGDRRQLLLPVDGNYFCRCGGLPWG